MLDGRLEVQKALDLGLIAIDGKQDQTEAIRHILLAATDRARTGVVAGNRAMPIRLFGAKR